MRPGVDWRNLVNLLYDSAFRTPWSTLGKATTLECLSLVLEIDKSFGNFALPTVLNSVVAFLRPASTSIWQ